MIKTTTSLLLVGAIVPALALALAAPVAGAERDGTIVIAQATPPDPKADPKKDKDKKKPQAPATTQPSKPTPPATAQPPKPQTPPPATAQPPKSAPPPAAAQPPKAPVQPAAREPAKPVVPPTASQPAKPEHPAAHERERAKPAQPAAVAPTNHPNPTAQPAAPGKQPPTVAQPVKPAQPAVAQPVKPAQPTVTGQPPTVAQPVKPAQPNVAGQPAAQPRAAAAVEVPHDRAAALDHARRAEQWRSRRVEDLRKERQESVEGGRAVIREPGRTIVLDGARPFIRHSEVERFGFGARDIAVERRGRETYTVVERPGGVRIVSVVDDDGRLLRRFRRYPDGRELLLIDNSFVDPEHADDFYLELAPPVVSIPRERYIVEAALADADAIYDALTAPPVERLDRRYSLDEVRYNPRLLDRMPRIDIDSITFDTGSWAIAPEQFDRLSVIAGAINRVIARKPQEVFLIEGHTDAVGSDVDNLSLSDRRAESVAAVLTEQFQVPPENMTTQGYGKQDLKIPTDGPERRNRRVTVRRITPLLGMGGSPPDR